MGCMLDKPICSKTGDVGDGNGLRWSVASMQGWRCEMEDTHAVRSGLHNTVATTAAAVTAAASAAPLTPADFGDWSFFAVFDGHAGDQSAAYSSQHLLDTIIATEAFQQRNTVEGIRTGFLGMDEALRERFATMAATTDNSGSTAIAAFVSPDHVYLANCGDSRAVLCRNGAPAFSTQDHKPVLPGERERIMNAGGSVIIQRVNGSLAVSRALGDFEYKNVLGKGQCEQLVSPEPEVFCVDRDATADQFMVLACDGIWDVMSNEELCSFVASRLRVTADLRVITEAVIDTCFHKGSRDNMSIIIVAFPGCPPPTEEAIEADADLNRKLVEIVKAHGKESTVDVIIQDIKDMNLEELPPGGGLEAVYPIILDTYREHNEAATEDSVLKDLATMT